MAGVFADVMLAKLARWLRLAGIAVYDVPRVEDVALLEYVKKKRGTLLTSDSALFARAKKHKVKALLIKQERIEKQMASVADSLGIKISSEPASICPICNSTLARVDKRKIEGLVPPTAYKRHRLFYLCRECNKAYWRGTHWEKIKTRLSRAKSVVARAKKPR